MCSTISAWRGASRTSWDKSSAMHDVKIRFTTNLRSERYDTDVEVILYRVDLRTGE